MISQSALLVSDGQTLTDAVYETVIKDISEGVWLVGAKLPTEAALCVQFGVSRPVVREALSRLRADGLVQSRKGSGSYVLRQPDRDVVRKTSVGSLMGLKRAFEFRICIEQENAYLAALHGDDLDIKQIRNAFEKLQDIYSTDQVGEKADLEFHMAVANASHNEFFVNAMTTASEIMGVSMTLLRTITLERPIERRKRIVEEHRLVVEAIEARDPDAAKLAMRYHILSGHDRLFDSRDPIK